LGDAAGSNDTAGLAVRFTGTHKRFHHGKAEISFWAVADPGILFVGGGAQQIQLRTEDRQNGDLGAVAP